MSGDSARSLPRFYKTVSVERRGESHGVALDGKGVRTPKKAELAVPTSALADVIAREWAEQGDRIRPDTMPLTRLANAAIDLVRGREGEVRSEIVSYAASDLVCYRAEGPEALVARQCEGWDPVLGWAETELGARLALAEGVMHVAQPADALARIAEALEPLESFNLAALHTLTTLSGSALLALAHARGRLTADEAWAAAHIDEDFQISQWGEDAEAAIRRAVRRAEFDAASKMLELLR